VVLVAKTQATYSRDDRAKDSLERGSGKEGGRERERLLGNVSHKYGQVAVAKLTTTTKNKTLRKPGFVPAWMHQKTSDVAMHNELLYVRKCKTQK